MVMIDHTVIFIYNWVVWVLSQPESVASLIGSFLAVMVAYSSLYFTERGHMRRDSEKEEQEIRYFLRGIFTEVKYLWERYYTAIGQYVQKLPDNEMLDSKVFISNDYFTFFHTNNFYIGKIKDESLQAQIIDFYIQAKGLIDTLSMNNHMLMKLEEHAAMMDIENPNFHNTFVQNYKEGLVEYAKSIKEQDEHTTRLANSLIIRLSNELKSN